MPTPNFSPLNNFASSTTAGFPPSPSAPSLLSNAPTNSTTADVWSNGLSTTNTNMDYNEYAKQLGLFMNAFTEQPKPSENEKSKSKRVFYPSSSSIYPRFLASSMIKSSKSKRTTSHNNNTPLSSDIVNDKTSTSKIVDESHPRPTSTSSSSTSSRRSSSNNPNKSSTSRSKPTPNSTSTSSIKTPTNNTDSTMLDPLAFAAASGGLTFPYFLPSLLSQSPSTTGTNTNPSTTYPFSSLSSSLMNPAAALYPFFSPDWFTSSSKFMDGFANIPSDQSIGNFFVKSSS